MSTGFLERSRLERKVIDLVNSSSLGLVELKGLSVGALTQWKTCIDNLVVEGRINVNAGKVERLLREISQRISSNSDASKHTFAGETFKSNSSVEVCISELNSELAGHV